MTLTAGIGRVAGLAALVLALAINVLGLTFESGADAHRVAIPRAAYNYDAAAAATTMSLSARIAASVAGNDGVQPATPNTAAIPARLAAEGAGRFASGKWLSHFENHGAEFGYKNSMEYLQGARSLIGRRGIQTYTRKNGDQLFYDSATNEFAVMTQGGTIRTSSPATTPRGRARAQGGRLASSAGAARR